MIYATEAASNIQYTIIIITIYIYSVVLLNIE